MGAAGLKATAASLQRDSNPPVQGLSIARINFALTSWRKEGSDGLFENSIDTWCKQENKTSVSGARS